MCIFDTTYFVHPFVLREHDATNEDQPRMETEELPSEAHQRQQPDAQHRHEPEMQELHHQGEMQAEIHDQQPEQDTTTTTTSTVAQHHQAVMHAQEAPPEREPSQDVPHIALQPLLDQTDQQQQNIPQQIIIQPQTMIIPPGQGSPPRVSVHYLTSNTTSQTRASYSPALQQNVAGVTQSDTALLHEVLNELATRSLFNP